MDELNGAHGLPEVAGAGFSLIEDGELRLPEEEVMGGEAGRTDDGDGAGEEGREANHPLEGLHATHGDANDGVKVGEVEVLGEEAVLGLDHISNGDAGEGAVEVGWGATDAVGEGVDEDDKEAGIVDEFIGSDEGFEAFGVAGEPSGEEHGVGAGGVELTEGAKTDAALWDAFAGGKLEVAEEEELLRGSRERGSQQGG